MQCLIPFISMTLVNVLFDFIQRMAFLQIMPYGICLAGSIISQAFAVYFACCIYKRIRVPPGEMEMGGFGSGGYNYDRVNRGDAPAQQGFHDARAQNTPKREDSLEDISLGSDPVLESRDADVVEAEVGNSCVTDVFHVLKSMLRSTHETGPVASSI